MVRDFTGHGIGTTFHSGLVVPHFDDPGDDIDGAGHDVHHRADADAGHHQLRDLADGWTVLTADRKRTAQFEHTLLVTADGAEILTQC